MPYHCIQNIPYITVRMISNIPIRSCFKVFKIFFIKITKYISKNQFLLEVQMLKSSRWWRWEITVSQADGGAGGPL